MTYNTTSDYWISPNAIRISLNADGCNRIQSSVTSGAKILVYMKGIPGLDYDAGHNYRRWTLITAPTAFPTYTAKYVYVAIPRPSTAASPVPAPDASASGETASRSSELGSVAQIVFPSERIDLYGRALRTNEAGETEEVQVGSEAYYYIFLHGIITSSGDNGNTPRDWQDGYNYADHTGTLSSDEAIAAGPTDSEWYKYSSVDELLTFLKDLTMKADTKFRALFAHTLTIVTGGKITFEQGGTIRGVAPVPTANVPDSSAVGTLTTDLIVTPAYAATQYLSKTHDDTAQGSLTFQKDVAVFGDTTLNKSTTVLGKFVADTLAWFKGIVTFGNYVKDHSGAIITPEGSAEFEDITARGSLTVQDLRFQRANIVLGTNIQSAYGGIIAAVTPFRDEEGNILPSGYATLQLEDGDICGAIEAGAFCMGYWHDITDKSNNATADSDDHQGTIHYKGFATVYFYVDEVNSADSTQFRYELKEGTTVHPYVGMHFRGIGSNRNLLAQSFIIATPNYTAAYNFVSSFLWDAQRNCTAISGSNIAGFEAMAGEQTGAWGNQYPATILTNLYVKGKFTQLEDKSFTLYLTQSSNGMLLSGETERVSFKVRNESFADVTSTWTIIITVKGVQTVLPQSSDPAFTIRFSDLTEVLTTYEVRAVKEGEDDLIATFTERKLIIDNTRFRIEPSRYAIKFSPKKSPTATVLSSFAADPSLSTLAADNGEELLLDDGNAIAAPASTDETVISARRISDTEVAETGTLYFSINGGVLTPCANDEPILIHSSDDNITFFWYEGDKNSRLLATITVPVTVDGDDGTDAVTYQIDMLEARVIDPYTIFHAFRAYIIKGEKRTEITPVNRDTLYLYPHCMASSEVNELWYDIASSDYKNNRWECLHGVPGNAPETWIAVALFNSSGDIAYNATPLASAVTTLALPGDNGVSPTLYSFEANTDAIYYDEDTKTYTPSILVVSFWKTIGDNRTGYSDTEAHILSETIDTGDDIEYNDYYPVFGGGDQDSQTVVEKNEIGFNIAKHYDEKYDRLLNLELTLPSQFGSKLFFPVVNTKTQGPQGKPGKDAVSYSLVASKTSTVENTVNDTITFTLYRYIGTQQQVMDSKEWSLGAENATTIPYVRDNTLTSTVGFAYGSEYTVGAYIGEKCVARFTLTVTAIGLRGTSFSFLDWSTLTFPHTFYSDNPNDPDGVNKVGKTYIGDVVIYNGTKYLCTKSYVTGAVLGSTDTPDQDTEHWTEVTNLGNVATNLLLAEKSIINNLLLNQLSAYPRNPDGSWDTDHPTVTIDAETGRIKAINGEFSGTIQADDVRQNLHIINKRGEYFDFKPIGNSTYAYNVPVTGDAYLSASDYVAPSSNPRSYLVHCWVVLPYAGKTMLGRCIEISAPNFAYLENRTNYHMLQIGITAIGSDDQWVNSNPGAESSINGNFCLQFGDYHCNAIILNSNKYTTQNDSSSVSKVKLICTEITGTTAGTQYKWLVQDSKNAYFTNNNTPGQPADYPSLPSF